MCFPNGRYYRPFFFGELFARNRVYLLVLKYKSHEN